MRHSLQARRHAMHRSKYVVLALTLVATAAAATSPGAVLPWRITLHSDREHGAAVYVMNADGSGVRRLVKSTKALIAGPWAPDGQRLLVYQNPGEVLVVDADGRGLRNLTRNAAFDCCASWSPDGRSIVFVSARDGNNELYMMNADGTGQRILAAS